MNKYPNGVREFNMSYEISSLQEKYEIIGREVELEKALMAANAGKHVLFEGAVGVGKTILAVALANHFKRGFYRVDGDERYTEHKLVGWFDPSTVIPKGYSWESFISGPLVQAMTEGAFLFINELNRMPEGTQNVLLPAMDEGHIIVPKIGTINAKPGFLVIATQNPEDYVGTSRISEALMDRFVWIPLQYQSPEEEAKIVQKETGFDNEDIILTAVDIARKTRDNTDIRRGASIRGAIDLTALISSFSSGKFVEESDVWVKASVMALGTKVELHDRTDKAIEEVIQSIVLSVLRSRENKKKQIL
jgi:MoxR-like ATPase